jgi:hypothetical protein
VTAFHLTGVPLHVTASSVLASLSRGSSPVGAPVTVPFALEKQRLNTEIQVLVAEMAAVKADAAAAASTQFEEIVHENFDSYDPQHPPRMLVSIEDCAGDGPGQLSFSRWLIRTLVLFGVALPCPQLDSSSPPSPFTACGCKGTSR